MIGLGLRNDDRAIPDLYMNGNDVVFVTDAEAIAQHVRQRLMVFQSEWFLDTTAGVPWLTRILGQGYDPVLAEGVIKSVVLATEGVTSIESFDVVFNRQTRELRVRQLDVRTIYDEIVSVGVIV